MTYKAYGLILRSKENLLALSSNPNVLNVDNVREMGYSATINLINVERLN